jgi:hypothetical protein
MYVLLCLLFFFFYNVHNLLYKIVIRISVYKIFCKKNVLKKKIGERVRNL